MTRPSRRGAFIALICLPALAHAHSPIKGLDSFYSGLLHPLFVPAHVLAIVALGIRFGQRGPRSSQAAIIAFLIATALGLVATMWLGERDVGIWLVTAAGCAGLLVALDRPLPLPLLAVLAVVTGFLLGMDSAQPAWSGRARLGALLGTAIAVYMLLLYLMAFSDWFGKRQWQKIGLRVVGSWIVATASLMVSLALVQPAGG